MEGKRENSRLTEFSSLGYWIGTDGDGKHRIIVQSKAYLFHPLIYIQPIFMRLYGLSNLSLFSILTLFGLMKSVSERKYKCMGIGHAKKEQYKEWLEQWA